VSGVPPQLNVNARSRFPPPAPAPRVQCGVIAVRRYARNEQSQLIERQFYTTRPCKTSHGSQDSEELALTDRFYGEASRRVDARYLDLGISLEVSHARFRRESRYIGAEKRKTQNAKRKTLHFADHRRDSCPCDPPRAPLLIA